MSQENEIESKKPSTTTDFLPSDGTSCSPSSTPETEAEWERKDPWRPIDMANAMKAKCDRLERERDEALTALMEIEEIFVDGSDTYDDWKSMGKIAREFLSENV
jgi:hypothetical protein